MHWTTDGAPLAVLSSSESDPLAALVESWPDAALLSGLPIAESWKGAGEVRRRVPVEAFAARTRAARGHPYAWTLSSTMTDLCVDERGEVAHAPFDPAGPGTIKWLHHRLVKVNEHVEPTAERIGDSLAGRAGRVKDNGLGFDQTRLCSKGRPEGVAGVHAPAFVERAWPAPARPGRSGGVAGVHAPAFVERTSRGRRRRFRGGVSPGFTPRPSLSGQDHQGQQVDQIGVSPGFTPRPSLSGAVQAADRSAVRARVAGVHAPAFVERAVVSKCESPGSCCVAGGCGEEGGVGTDDRLLGRTQEASR